MKKFKITLFYFGLAFFLCQSSFGQISFNGTVKDAATNEAIFFAQIQTALNKSYTDEDGHFSIELNAVPSTIQYSAFGYKTQELELSSINEQFIIYLELDPLLLDDVVITDFQSQTALRTSPSSVTSLPNPLDVSVNGTPDILSTIPGMYVDASLGEGFSRVYTRGISASAEDDIGWFYTSLQEDGLPVSAVQYNYFTPDFFQRPDLMNKKVEVIRGGKSGILNQNAPGAAINFISRPAASLQKGEIKATLGMQGESNPYYRLDGLFKIPIESKFVNASIGGFYRYDQGQRNTDYAWNKGGQLKAQFQYFSAFSALSIRAKYLDDHINRYTGVSATNWANPEVAFGQNFNSTALMLPSFSSEIPGANGYSFDPSNGIHTKEQSIQVDYDLSLRGWTISNKMKYSRKQVDWQTSFSNARLGLENFLLYFVSGAEFPFGVVQFNDAETGTAVATVNNAGALNVFQGEAPTFEYIQGSVPNDALMGIAPWKKEDQLTEWMAQFNVSRDFGSHHFIGGLFASASSLEYYTSASFAFATFEPNSRLLSVSLTDFEGNMSQLSDASGMSNYGGLFFEQGALESSQVALYFNDTYQINSSFLMDFGIRYESILHQGDLAIPENFEGEGGLDGNPETQYDNGFMQASDNVQSIDFAYNHLSFSGGFNYKITPSQDLYGRFSRTNKAPELNYYIQNFSGFPLENKGETQVITQAEFGIKQSSTKMDFAVTGFWSQLDNIALSGFVFDQQTSQIFYTPIQFNKSSTYGLEFNWFLKANELFSLQGSHTFQASKANEYTIYDASGTADPSDDSTIDFSGNELPHTPKVMSYLSFQAKKNKWSGNLGLRMMGKRFGNSENSFTLPSFTTFSGKITYKVSPKTDIQLQAKNIFNSGGLMNFFGPNDFGGSANDATKEFINQNPDASFVVFPIMPRAVYLSFNVRF